MINNTLFNKVLRNLPLFVLYGCVGVLIFSRCANQGMPMGGPKDSIAPVLVETMPQMMGLNFSGEEVRLTFNEYIVPDAVAEELVVSPPLAKRPSVRTKSRSLIVAFNETLKKDVTYSLDFKNSVVDNNEHIPIPGLRFLFSTGNSVDTLRVAGMVKSAENLEPFEKITVMLHSNTHDTALFRSKPDYIARTDKKGLFLFDNVKSGKYHLFAVNDLNSNLLYDPGTEEFAFADSLILPSAEFIESPDTLAIGADSLLILGHTLFKPDPVYLRTFTEPLFEQYIDKSIREGKNKCRIVFNESIKDTLGIRLLNHPDTAWYIREYNREMDSLLLWITDTLLANIDTLQLELAFMQLDSLRNSFVQHDTINLVYTEKEKPETRRKKKEEEEPVVEQFWLSDNIKSTGFDLNSPVYLTTPEPVKKFDLTKVRLILAEDSTLTPLKISIQKDTTMWRTYRIDYPWEPKTGYILFVDSAASENYSGITSQKVKKQFITQEEDYYGRIVLNLSNAEDPLLIHLLDNSKDEKVLRTITTHKKNPVMFDFLAPGKYKIKVVFDKNDNGKWDPGIYSRRIQPEKVAYYPEIIKVRSNWDNNYEWDLSLDPTYRKVLIDKEEEELRLKKLKEEKEKEKEQERGMPSSNPAQEFGVPGMF